MEFNVPRIKLLMCFLKSVPSPGPPQSTCVHLVQLPGTWVILSPSSSSHPTRNKPDHSVSKIYLKPTAPLHPHHHSPRPSRTTTLTYCNSFRAALSTSSLSSSSLFFTQQHLFLKVHWPCHLMLKSLQWFCNDLDAIQHLQQDQQDPPWPGPDLSLQPSVPPLSFPCVTPKPYWAYSRLQIIDSCWLNYCF